MPQRLKTEKKRRISNIQRPTAELRRNGNNKNSLASSLHYSAILLMDILRFVVCLSIFGLILKRKWAADWLPISKLVIRAPRLLALRSVADHHQEAIAVEDGDLHLPGL